MQLWSAFQTIGWQETFADQKNFIVLVFIVNLKIYTSQTQQRKYLWVTDEKRSSVLQCQLEHSFVLEGQQQVASSQPTN